MVLKPKITGQDGFQLVKNAINPYTDGVTFAKPLPGGGVLIACQDQSKLKNVQQKLQQNLTPILKKEKRNPEIVIHHLPKSCTVHEIEQAIVNSTGCNPQHTKVMRYRHDDPNSGIFATAVVTPAAWKLLVGTHEKILIGGDSWAVCPVANNIPLIKCTQCHQYGHLKKYCRLPPATKEAGTCLNCARVNQKNPSATPLDTNHDTHSKNCTCLINHLNAVSKTIQYE